MLSLAMGEEWKFLRKSPAHSFTIGKIRLLSTIFNNSTDTCMDLLHEMHKTGKEFDIKRSVILDIIKVISVYMVVMRTSYSYF